MNCEMHCVPVSSTLFIAVHFSLEKGSSNFFDAGRLEE